MVYTGLNKKEAEKNLLKYGKNEIRDTSRLSPFQIFLRQIKKNFVIYLLLFAMILSFSVGKLLTGYIVLMVIIVVITTGFIQEYKAEKAMEALRGMLVPVSIVIRDGKEQEVLSKEIVPGDILVLRNGEKIPADCIVLEQRDLLINESILTGESKEVGKKETKNMKNSWE
jgi:Ca2+-transporting ATPase